MFTTPIFVIYSDTIVGRYPNNVKNAVDEEGEGQSHRILEHSWISVLILSTGNA